MKKEKQSGFAGLAVAILIAAVGGIGFYHGTQNPDAGKDKVSQYPTGKR